VADASLRLAVAGLAGMMLAEVPQVLSGFLPSPSTMYDKASGGIETGPESLAVLKRSAVKGTVVTIIMAASVSAMAYGVIGGHAIWLFLLAMAVLALFLHDCWQAVQKGKAAAGSGG
jgi:hypothetical protein